VKISGTHTINAPRQAVWDRLIDPEAIARCLPGVERLNPVSQDEYEMTMTVGIGPVRGTYDGKVRLANMRAQEEYQIQVEGSGRPGFVRGTGTVRLADGAGGTTEIAYEGDVEVGGPVAGVAQRMLGGVAKRLVDQFFSCIEKQITSG